MESTTQFKKLPRLARELLLKFRRDANITQLFVDIKANVDTQTTHGSKIVRTAQFIGILKRHFDFSEKDVAPIQISKDDYDQYNKKLKKNFETKQHESVIDLELFNAILGVNDLSFLLLTSGARVNEILQKVVDFKDDNVFIELSKKRNDTIETKMHKVLLLCPLDEWRTRYELLKAGNLTNEASYLNRMLKNIIPKEFYKKSSHLLRSVYCRFVYEFLNPKNRTLSQIITKYLGHDTTNSAAHYQHVTLHPI